MTNKSIFKSFDCYLLIYFKDTARSLRAVSRVFNDHTLPDGNESTSQSFNGDIFRIVGNRFCFFLRNKQFQDTVFVLALDVFLCNIFTYIEASLAGSCVTFTSDVTSCLLVIIFLIKAFSCTDCQITIFQCYLNFIFLESRNINYKFITFLGFFNIGLQKILCPYSFFSAFFSSLSS